MVVRCRVRLFFSVFEFFDEGEWDEFNGISIFLFRLNDLNSLFFGIIENSLSLHSHN